jgi:hypothetical protein
LRQIIFSCGKWKLEQLSERAKIHIVSVHDIHNQALCKNSSLLSYQEPKTMPVLHNHGTVLCIAVKVEVFYQQFMKLNYDIYDFPMPVYARKSIYIKHFGNFGYTDTHFT